MEKHSLKKFVQSWMVNTLAVLVAVLIIPGLHFHERNLLAPFIASLVLGILNAFFRPLLMYLALPLLLFSLGLFMLVINAFLLYLVGLLMGAYFEVDSFGSALLGAVVIAFVSLLLNVFLGLNQARVQVTRRRPPSGAGPGGNGPVIDV